MISLSLSFAIKTTIPRDLISSFRYYSLLKRFSFFFVLPKLIILIFGVN